jgi:hypothetical protein
VEVTAKLDHERGRIAAAEAEKAKRLLATDLEDRTRQIAVETLLATTSRPLKNSEIS